MAESLGELAPAPELDERWLERLGPKLAPDRPAHDENREVTQEAPTDYMDGSQTTDDISPPARSLPPEVLSIMADDLMHLQQRLSDLQEGLEQAWAACASSRNMLEAVRSWQTAALSSAAGEKPRAGAAESAEPGGEEPSAPTPPGAGERVSATEPDPSAGSSTVNRPAAADGARGVG